jgi:hypothetical protein
MSIFLQQHRRALEKHGLFEYNRPTSTEDTYAKTAYPDIVERERRARRA